MPQDAWTPKRERQYEHIKTEEKKRGRSEDTAERIAAATVNRTRTAKGETKERTEIPDRAQARAAEGLFGEQARREGVALPPPDVTRSSGGPPRAAPSRRRRSRTSRRTPGGSTADR